MSDQKRLKIVAPQIRESLCKGNVAEFETHGHSMIPLLHDGGDKVRLIKPEGGLKVGDVAFCYTDDERYVLHRVTGIRNGGYTLRGDNCLNSEFCRSDDDVIGVACAFIRNGRLIQTDSLRYRFYCRFRKQLLSLWKYFWKYADKAVTVKQKISRK